jgi:epsin
MDRLENLGNTLSNITLYDIKSMYNQAKNVVLNVSEMEAKVREATNDDPWGASSTLMQEIAQGTFNFQQFNEIMPCIYSQFMEKEARQWRQIYKALQLLEYLIKHGSERVVDDARSHISTLKMLRSFHYIDEKGKDQGLNVRNRSKELVELLADVDKIRRERKEAKANRSKYVGTGNDGFSFGGGGGRYGGFGNDALGAGGSYSGDYGTRASGTERDPASGSSSAFRDNSPRRSDFEEYDAGEFETTPRRVTSAGTNTSTNQTASTRTSTAQSKIVAKAPEPAPASVVNLLDFDDDNPAPSTGPASVAVNKALPALAPLVGNDNTEDDFADFQAAPPSAPASATTTAPRPAPGAAPKPNLMDLLSSTPAAPSPATYRPTQPAQTQPFGAFNTVLTPSSQVRPSSTPVSAPSYAAMPAMGAARSAVASPVSGGPTPLPGKPAKSGGGGFDDLWSMSLGSAATSKPSASAGAGKSIRDLEKEKAQAGIWGAQSQARSPATGGFGSFTTNATTGSAVGGAPAGADDLLL